MKIAPGDEVVEGFRWWTNRQFEIHFNDWQQLAEFGGKRWVFPATADGADKFGIRR